MKLGQLAYEQERQEIAWELGYPDYFTGIRYRHCVLKMSLKENAEPFGISKFTVRNNLLAAGDKMRARGGKNNLKGGKRGKR